MEMKQPLAVLLLLSAGILLLGCVEPLENKCETDADCALAVRLNKCCSCHEAVHKSEIEADPNITLYEFRKDYSELMTVGCEEVQCAPCAPLGSTSAVCREGTCTTEYSNCDTHREEINDKIEEANYCEKDSDCTAELFDCPFGCHRYINKSADTSEIRKMIEEYRSNCEYCEYTCHFPPTEFQCVDGKCSEKGEIQTWKNCSEYEVPMSQNERNNCTCSEGYKKFYCLAWAYCGTESGNPCSTSEDCPKGEHCISDDGKNWFCTSSACGCYYNDPENPEMEICVD